ncbi:MAG: cation diffusion facilitator family transporter, partial [Salinivirgaceae bacterium]
MSSDHHHMHEGQTRNIRFAFILNLLFAIVEIIGGLLTNSVAILADAVHDLGDSLSLGASWFFEKYSTKKKNRIYPYGYRRFSLLGALINAIVLIGGTVYVLTEIVQRLFQPQEVVTEGMFALAIVGVAINGIAAFRLSRNSSLNSRMVMLHLLEDVLGWAAVLVASITIHFTGWHSIDAWLSLFIAIWVLYNASKGLKQVMKVLLQSTPLNFDFEKASTFVEEIDGVRNFHDLRVWTLDGERHVGSMHLVIDPNKIDSSLA